MRTLSRTIAMAVLCRAALGAPAFGGVVDFEDLGLAPNSFNNNSGGFSSGGAGFNNVFTDFGGFTAWSGWSSSNIMNAVDPSFSNQYAAIPGAGFGGAGNYGVGFSFSLNDAWINLPAQSQPSSIRIANTTYAFFTMLNGDPFGFSQKFGGADGNRPDFFKLIITGFDGLNASGSNVGAVEHFLADYRFANNALDFIADDWRLVDLSGLASARSLGFAFESSDVDPVFGINTPTYFAADDLITISAASVPEPSPWILSGLALISLAGWNWARTRGRSRSSELTNDQHSVEFLTDADGPGAASRIFERAPASS